MSNLIDIQSQIEKLQKQASDIKAREFNKTVREIVAKMQAFGITQEDLRSASSRATKSREERVKPMRGKSVKAVAKVAVPAKYRGPEGETWSGRGLTPRWLAALVAQGRKKEDFVIEH